VLEEDRGFVLSLRVSSRPIDWCTFICTIYALRCFHISRSQTDGLLKGKVSVWVLSQTLPPPIVCSKWDSRTGGGGVGVGICPSGSFIHSVFWSLKV
jgi:hypothetical protein